jgi:nicotinate-nucleotide pyrophosphorylase (carboxylating)
VQEVKVKSMFIPRRIIEEKLKKILSDDIGQGDVTVAAIIPPRLIVRAEVLTKEDGIVAGIEEATILAEYTGLEVNTKVTDGEKIKKNQILLQFSGDAQTILSIERTLLNILSRMSGIATKTRTLTEKLEGAKVNAKIAATRKSAPGLLHFDKKAVVIGTGDSHRFHLDDMILIKDNHLAIVGGIREAVKKAKANASFTKKIEVETTNIDDALEAAKAGADIIMLDNFSPSSAKKAAQKLRKAGFTDVLLEVSGGITAENILDFANAQIDVISMGEITHSVKALDISLEISKK